MWSTREAIFRAQQLVRTALRSVEIISTFMYSSPVGLGEVSTGRPPLFVRNSAGSKHAKLLFLGHDHVHPPNLH